MRIETTSANVFAATCRALFLESVQFLTKLDGETYIITLTGGF